MVTEPGESVALDLADFDAVGVAGAIVDGVRQRAIEHHTDCSARVPGPAGWHNVVVTARSSGHVVLSVRYGPLTPSRWHNVERGLRQRGWLLDEDGDGATQRFPPGTEPATVAFELLAVAVLGGAPCDSRLVLVAGVAGRSKPQ